MRFKKGDRVRDKRDGRVGNVVKIKERGVAGCAVTYTEYLEIDFGNEIAKKQPPSYFEVIDE